jgi:hypothetical protein
MTILPQLEVPTTLLDYARENSHTYSSLCNLLEITPGHLGSILSGAVRPSLVIALRIECFTGGRVPAHCWYPTTAWAHFDKACATCAGVGRIRALPLSSGKRPIVICKRCMGTGKRLYEARELEVIDDGVQDYTVTEGVI